MQQFCVSCLPPSGRRSSLHCVWKREEPPSHRLLSAASWAWAHRKVFPQGEWGGNGGLRMEQGGKRMNTETEKGSNVCRKKKKIHEERFHAFDHLNTVYGAEWMRPGWTFLPRFFVFKPDTLISCMHATISRSHNRCFVMTLWAGSSLASWLEKILCNRLNYQWLVSYGMSERQTGWPNHSWCQVFWMGLTRISRGLYHTLLRSIVGIQLIVWAQTDFYLELMW